MAVDKARLFDDILRALSLVIDWHEGEQLLHAWRVGWLAQAVGRQAGVADPTLYLYAGLLHDVGAVGHEEHVVNAALRGFRDAQDREHPAASVRILTPLRVLAPVLPLVADHHERFDGGGFPKARKRDEIAPGALLVALADQLELAFRTAPPAERGEAVRRLLREESGRAWPQELARAAQALLDRDPTVLELLHDPEALRAAVARAGDARRWVEGVEPLELMGQLLWLFSGVVEAKHPSTLGHAVRVTGSAHRIARALGEHGPGAWDVVFAGLLHDVGLAALPRSLVTREGHPSAEPAGALRRHALETHTILASIRDLAHLAAPAASHHECYDGSGFPFGWSGEQIPLLGRILAYADAYDALTAPRPGRPGLGQQEALRRLRQEVGTRLDPHLAEVALGELARSEPVLQEGASHGALLALLQEGAPDVRGALRRAQRAAVPGGPATRSGGGAPRWRVVEFDEAGAPRRGLEALQEVAGPRLARLWDLVDAEVGRQLDRAGPVAEDATAAVPLVSAQGHPVEAVLRRRADGWELLYRDAGRQARTVERMALFHRNFLASSEAAFFVDSEGRIADASDRFLELYGHERDALLGRTPPIFGTGGKGPGLAGLLARAHEGGSGGWVGEVSTTRADGAPLPALVTVSLVRDPTGTPVGYSFRLVDISARLRLEQELAAKNDSLEAVGRLKSELLAIASHDLKAPVASMISLARQLRGQLGGAGPAALHRLDLLVRLGQGGLVLIDRMLCLEQIETGTFRLQVVPIRLDRLLADCVEGLAPVAQERGVELSLGSPAPVRVSSGDPTRLGQVFDNLVSNALRYAPPGSRVEVACRDLGDRLRCEVSDRGPGIPPAERERIFERYYQLGGGVRGGGGVGLGLHVTRSVVSLHGGQVFVEGRQGGGSRFVVELPTSAALSPGPPAVLLLDPSGALELQLGPVLATAGLRALVARDWVEAARLGAAGAPELLVASAAEQELAVRAEEAAPGCRPVAVREPGGAEGALLVEEAGAELVVLEAPVMPVELSALAQEVRRRRRAAAAVGSGVPGGAPSRPFGGTIP